MICIGCISLAMRMKHHMLLGYSSHFHPSHCPLLSIFRVVLCFRVRWIFMGIKWILRYNTNAALIAFIFHLLYWPNGFGWDIKQRKNTTRKISHKTFFFFCSCFQFPIIHICESHTVIFPFGVRVRGFLFCSVAGYWNVAAKY